MVINTQLHQHYVEIMPAALLSKRTEWQVAGQALPPGTYFLIADRDNEQQIRFMHHLTQLFRQRGKQAGLLYVSKIQNR